MARYFDAGAMPSRKHASVYEDESLADWLRRQSHPKKKAPAATGTQNQNTSKEN